MSPIIICTDFSATSRNALAYTCDLVKDKAKAAGIELLLLHVFSIPANYSGEGLSIITINDEWHDAEVQMQEELAWAREQFPEVSITGQLATGSLLDGLQEQIAIIKPSLVVIGTSGDFSDLWSWDRDILDLLRDATVPILAIPPQVTFTPVQAIGYACNLKYVTPFTPFETIKKWVRFTGATLHVLTVTTPDLERINNQPAEEFVKQALEAVAPQYHTVHETHVVECIGHFVHEQQVDLLMVTPKRHGTWDALFRKSYTKALMQLNAIPIMALHGK